MEVKPLLPPVVPKKPVSESAPNRLVPRRSRSDLYYYSYNELGESDQQFLSDYWKAIDSQFQPVSPEMAKLVLGLTDFPPIPFAKTATDDRSVSMSERLLSCLIPEDESQGSCSFPLSSSIPVPRMRGSLLHNKSRSFSETDSQRQYLRRGELGISRLAPPY